MKYAYLPYCIGTAMTGDKIPGNNSLQLHCFTELVKPGSEMMVKTVKEWHHVSICGFNFVLLQYGNMVKHVPHNHSRMTVLYQSRFRRW